MRGCASGTGARLFGSATLLARRLVERGVRFVNVSWDNYSKRFEVSKAAWDTHERNFPMLRETLLPNFDQTYSAFLADLDARGLLDETLVVTMGEMGRTPKINAKGGRDHWTYCYSVLLAGAGIKGGMTFGASDEQAAFIKDKPVHIRDICATIYHLLGIDPEMPVYDRGGRPIAIAHGGHAVSEILGLATRGGPPSSAYLHHNIEPLSGAAGRLRAGRDDLLDPPLEGPRPAGAVAFERHGDDHLGRARSIGRPREQTGRLVDREPSRSLLDGEPGPFDVPEAHRLLAVDDPGPEIAQRSDGRDRIAIIRPFRRPRSRAR